MEFSSDSRYIVFANNCYYVVKYTGYSDNYYKFKTVNPTSDELQSYSSSYEISTKGVGRTLKFIDYEIESSEIIQIS
jgi:hypothetical protein